MRVAFVALLFCACGARPDLSAPASVSSVSPQKLVITQGGEPVDIAIHVVNAFTDDVQVDIPSLPLELSATSVTIPAGVSDAAISIRATREAEQGPAGPIELRAVTKHGEQRFPLDVFVRGCPGCLDNTYADNGATNVPHGVHLVAVDASDRVVVLATASATSSIVSRVHDDGSADPSFAEVALPGRWDAMALDADGGAYLAGSDGQQPPHGVAAHVTSTGLLDMSFTFPDADTAFGSLAVASDGSAFVSGYEGYPNTVVVKLRPTGAPDASFGDGGVLHVAGAWAAGVACDGPLVLVTGEGSVHRLDASGAVDTTFGQAGVLSTKMVLAQTFVTRDRYFVAGYDLKGGGASGVVLAVTRDGTLDSSFGEGGHRHGDGGHDVLGVVRARDHIRARWKARRRRSGDVRRSGRDDVRRSHQPRRHAGHRVRERGRALDGLERSSRRAAIRRSHRRRRCADVG